MNRYYKEKKFARGGFSTSRGKALQLLPTPMASRPRNTTMHQQSLITHFPDHSSNARIQVLSTGRGRGSVPPRNNGNHWSRENSTFSQGSNNSFANNVDENAWEDMDYDFDDPSVIAPVQGIYDSKCCGASGKIGFTGNRSDLTSARRGHSYTNSTYSQASFSKAGPSHNYERTMSNYGRIMDNHGRTMDNYGRTMDNYGPVMERRYDACGANNNMYRPFSHGEPMDIEQNAPDRYGYLQQPEKPNPVEYRKEKPLEATTSVMQDESQSAIEEGKFPRIYTVSVAKLQSWPKYNINGEILFEVFGILDSMKDDGLAGVKVFILKGQQQNKITCVFYEIDRKLDVGDIGHWQRCVGLLKNNEFQCLSLRSATQNELQTFGSTLTANSKAMATFLRSSSG